MFHVVAFDGYVVVEMESREATLSPAAEVEARVEEKVDLSEQLDALKVDEEDRPEDPAQVEIPLPNSEESASLPVQTAPSTASLPAEDDTTSSGEKPKVSYASIVSYCYVCSSSIIQS